MKHLRTSSIPIAAWTSSVIIAVLALFPSMVMAQDVPDMQETPDYRSAAGIECAEELLPELADEVYGQQAADGQSVDSGQQALDGNAASLEGNDKSAAADNKSADADIRFITGRLIVMSSDVPETYGAADVWQLGTDQTILEYKTAEDAKAAFAKLEKKYECYPDELLSIESSDINTGGDGDIELGMEMSALRGTPTVKGDGDIDLSMGMSSLKGAPLGRDVMVAVLDTGIDSSDPWFAKNGTQGSRISAASYDFIKDSATLTDGDKTKTHKGHGTLVAGTLAERTPDNVNIMALRIQSSGDPSSVKMTTLLLIGSALRYAMANGADVINMSFDLNPASGSSSALNYLDGIIEDAWEQGIPCCVASGNDGHAVNDSDYPACVSTAVTVGSVNTKGIMSDFSNYGSTIDFTAPGELDQGRSGTSFAAPGIAACFAYLIGKEPDASADELYEDLRTLCSDPGDTGWDERYGWGIPDLTSLASEPAHHYVKTVTKAATCTEEGIATYRCSDAGCGASYEEIIPETGHTWHASAEGEQLIFRCDNKRCDAVITAGDLEGELNGGFSWHVEKAGVNTADTPVAHLIIGGTGNLPEMDAYPWEGCSDYITQIILKDTVTSIPEGAFRGMKVLGSVAHTDDLTDGAVREGLPTGLTNIGRSAFAGCSNLKQLLIGQNVTTVGDGAFAGCQRLTGITVDEGSSAFTAEKGCLYNKNKTVLYFCANDTGAYASSVTTIAPEAFSGQSISFIEIGENVTTIGDRAFAGCGDLRIADFTGTVDRSIGAKAFAQVNADVYVPEGASGTWTGTNYGGTLRWHETNLNETSVNVELDQTKWVYTGQEIRPAVTVSAKAGGVLTENVDYTLAYSGNLAPGTGSVRILGTDNGWSGVVTRTFRIDKAVFSFKNIQVPDTIHAGQELIVTYKGTPIKDMPDLEVKYSSDPEGMFELIGEDGEDGGNRLMAAKKGECTLIVTADTNEYFKADIAKGYPITVLACLDSDHSWDDGKVTLKPTYSKAGKREYTCENCGEKKIAKIPRLTGAAVGTKYKKGSLTYKVKSGSVLQVTASKNVKSVTIPKTVTINKKTYKVTSIGAKAFYKKSKLKTIKIKSTKIKSFGKSSFAKLPKKGVVKVPKSKLKTYRTKIRKAGFKGKKQKIKAL